MSTITVNPSSVKASSTSQYTRVSLNPDAHTPAIFYPISTLYFH